jgi:hypothetical protein
MQMIDQLTELAGWLIRLISDLASGRKTEAEARDELQKAGIVITETDSDRELKAHEDAGGGADPE